MPKLNCFCLRANSRILCSPPHGAKGIPSWRAFNWMSSGSCTGTACISFKHVTVSIFNIRSLLVLLLHHVSSRLSQQSGSACRLAGRSSDDGAGGEAAARVPDFQVACMSRVWWTMVNSSRRVAQLAFHDLNDSQHQDAQGVLYRQPGSGFRQSLASVWTAQGMWKLLQAHGRCHGRTAWSSNSPSLKEGIDDPEEVLSLDAEPTC